VKTTAEISRILSAIKEYNKFMITSHMDPDGDSIGSQLGLYHALRDAGKKTVIINQGAVPAKYNFLDAGGVIKSQDKKIDFVPEVVFIIECPSLERIGLVRNSIPESAITINIDHHPGNSQYADINLVDSEGSAAGEIIYFMLELGGYEITPEIARQLYAAIAADTGGFRFGSTSARGMKAASELIQRGADPKFISDRLFNNFSPETIRLLGHTLASLKLEADGRIGYVTVTLDDLNRSGADLQNSEGFVDFTLAISGIMLGILFKEVSSDEVKVSVRSQDSFDAAAFARMFNGGGHTNAAGFTQRGRLDSIVDCVISRAREFVIGG
jgi:phosphoesterase RecJ-like protein